MLAAMCNGVSPFLSLALTSAPWASSNSTMSLLLTLTASCNGVSPPLSVALTSAPLASSNSTISLCGMFAAIHKGVQPLLVLALTVANYGYPLVQFVFLNRTAVPAFQVTTE